VWECAFWGIRSLDYGSLFRQSLPGQKPSQVRRGTSSGHAEVEKVGGPGQSVLKWAQEQYCPLAGAGNSAGGAEERQLGAKRRKWAGKGISLLRWKPQLGALAGRVGREGWQAMPRAGTAGAANRPEQRKRRGAGGHMGHAASS
jgi:hypothetical protein